MLRLALATASVAVLSTTAFAQTVTSPKGLDTTEGNVSFLHFTSTRRFQSVDNTHAGSTLLVKQLGWRRDGGASGGGANAPARTFDLEVKMGHVSMTKLSREFDKNTGGAGVVFTKKNVNFPDWTGNAGSPAPFDFQVPLDSNFLYGGNQALLIDFSFDNLVSTVTTGVSVDRDYIGSTNSTSTLLGTGCSGYAHVARLENNGPALPNYGMRMRVNGTGAPPGANVLLNIDFSDANLPIPGLCANVRALPTISIDLGPSDAGGALLECSISFPYNAAIQGATFVTQFLSLDASQPGLPVRVSNGRQNTMPTNSNATGHEALYGWSTLPTTNGTLFWGGTMVIQLGL
jgi:hypothetical protein